MGENAGIFLGLDDDVASLHGSVAMEIVEKMFRIHFVFYLCHTRRTEE